MISNAFIFVFKIQQAFASVSNRATGFNPKHEYLGERFSELKKIFHL
jgi:hypothetical protein